MQQTSHVTFAADAADAADASSGLPQVSVLTVKKQKEILKKRREALIAGKGKSYPGVGTHRRGTVNKHTWTYGELAELSATFMEHYERKPLWKIAQEIHASFALQLQHQQALDAAAATATNPQEEQVAQLREPRTHLPTVTAIELKLVDCTSLHYNDAHNYISKPSQMHHEVWSHLLRAQKHRTMIRGMTTATKHEPQEQEPEQKQEPEPEHEIWNVHAREFMYDSVAEYEAAFPPAKRRKLNPNPNTEDEQEQEQEQEQVIVGEIEMEDNTNDDGMNMVEICEALDEIADQINEREHNRQSTYIAVNASLTQIQAREQQIANLLTTLRDTTSEIETHRRAITCEMERIRAIVDPAPPAYSAPASASASAQQAQAAFDPNHYQCRECSQMFNPLVLGYWLIGPNRETGDTFYLCRECTKFMDDTQQTQTTSQRIDEEEEDQDQDQHQHQDQGCGGDCDCWDDDSEGEWEDCEEEPQNGGYDHGEECS
jgi:hypothetical protein